MYGIGSSIFFIGYALFQVSSGVPLYMSFCAWPGSLRLVIMGCILIGNGIRDMAMQVPSNMVLIRLGPRVWLPIIIVAWGVVATLFAGLKSATDFYVLRLLLGVAESGSFPGASLLYSRSLLYTAKDQCL